MLLIGNGQLITRDPEFPYLKDGAVVCDGEVIKAVGTLADMKAAYPDAEFLSLGEEGTLVDLGVSLAPGRYHSKAAIALCEVMTRVLGQ